MSSRAHQRWALFAASLLLLVSVVNLLFVDHRRSPVWVDLTLFGMAEVLLLVAYSWIMTVVVPRSGRLRVVVLVALLLLYAATTAIISLSWFDTFSMAPLLPVLALGCVLGVLAWLAVKSVRRRRVGCVVSSGGLVVFIGVLGLGLLVVGYGFGCALSLGCSKSFPEAVFSSPGTTLWLLVSAGLVMIGVGLWVHAFGLHQQKLDERVDTK
jgi:hypothetical protein